MIPITLDDLRVAGVGTCPQARAWAQRNGMSFRDVREGRVTTDRLRALIGGDDEAYLKRVISVAEARHERR